jgi:hypothetical protein
MMDLCSNRAATRVNVLKGREERQFKNMAICRNSASSRNLQQTIALPSHGRGRWFEPSIAHFKSPANGRKSEASSFRVESFVQQRENTSTNHHSDIDASVSRMKYYPLKSCNTSASGRGAEKQRVVR